MFLFGVSQSFFASSLLLAVSDSKMPVTKEVLNKAQSMIDGIIKEACCGPIFVRLAWHDSGTFDASIKEAWPAGKL